MRCRDLLKAGWTLNHIDEMDVHFYFELEQDEMKAQNRPTKPPKMGHIDDIF